LSEHGYGETTLLATSFCADEVNRDLEKDFIGIYGDNFSMGGLSGFPFCGITSFGAMAAHIPEGGSCLILYGPHVGVDLDGNVGKVNRRGQKGPNGCCGSAIAASAYVKAVRAAEVDKQGPPKKPLDAQQAWVGAQLLPHSRRLEKAKEPNVELPLTLFECVDEVMKRIVDAACGSVAAPGKIALLGGVLINTPEGTSDYFLPKVFEIRDNTNDLEENLLPFL